MEARDWEAAGAQVHDDVVVDWPHSGERLRGRENYMAVQRNYPEGWRVDVLRVVATGDVAAAEVKVEHGEERFFCAGFYELRDARIVKGTEYWVTAGAEEPPAWRAPWTERM
jgi:hypothetical protein